MVEFLCALDLPSANGPRIMRAMLYFLTVLSACSDVIYYGGGTLEVTFAEADVDVEWSAQLPPQGSLTLNGVSREQMDTRDDRWGDLCVEDEECMYGAWYRHDEYTGDDYYQIRGWFPIDEEIPFVGGHRRCGSEPTAVNVALIEGFGMYVTFEGVGLVEDMTAQASEGFWIENDQRKSGSLTLPYVWHDGCGDDPGPLTLDSLTMEWNFEYSVEDSLEH